mgnify:CR=1 FL=1
MRVLPDLTQKPHLGRRLATTVLVREDGFVQSHSFAEPVHRVWNALSKERVHTHEPVPEPSARLSRQHQAAPKRNTKRLYTPQDQRGVETRFVIEDRVTGQVLARVKGGALH